MPLITGSHLGPFEILDLLGAGGMGEVYRARDTSLQRYVAIKVLPGSYSSDPDRLRRFQLEARAAAALNHPNILCIFHTGQHDGSPYIVSELLEGEALRNRLCRGPMRLREVLDVAVDVTRGLAAAHEKGIIHRDLKPENLFLTKDGRVKILDFGLAKLTQPRSPAGDTQTLSLQELTSRGEILGTAGYMSPEQVRGQPADSRSDIFAFGAVLYEMLTGRRAFKGENAADTLGAILYTDPPALSTCNREIPPVLARIVPRCLDKSPEQRFQSADDLRYTLEAASGALDSTHVADNTAPRLADGETDTRIASLGADFLDSIAVLPFRSASGESDIAYLSEGITSSLINNLAQLRDLRVVPATTAFKYIGREIETSQCARELDVRVILTGEIAKHGDGPTISAELIDAVHESQLWGARYDCQLEDIVAIQTEIASQVAARLRLRVSDAERKQLARLPTGNREAYHLYLKAIHWANKWTAEGMTKGIDYTRQAIDADPTYAEAWTALAYLYTLLGAVGRAPADETFAKAKAAARKALEIDNDSANAHAILGYLQLISDWNWQGAYDSSLRAIDIRPNLAGGHYVYSYWYLTQGLFQEALSEAELARKLDPLSANLSLHLGLIHYFARRYDQAIEQFDKTRELDPSFSFVARWHAFTYARLGMPHEALAELDKIVVHTATDSLVSKALRGMIDAMTGKRSEARRILDELTQELKPPDFLFAYPCAVIHSLLGGKDEALACLEMCLQGRAPQLPWLAVDPDFASLHDDPRFDELLGRIGIPIAGTLKSSHRKERAVS